MMEENKSSNPRLLITFVMDNSASVSAERLHVMQDAFGAFAAATAENSDLEWELITFDGFSPKVVKAFEAKELQPVAPNGFPLLGRATMVALDRLGLRLEALRAAEVAVHRPWIFLLSDGFTMDTMTEVSSRLDSMEREGRVIYLPFKLTEKLSTERLQALDRNKHMIEIKEGKIQAFFDFVARMISQRAALAPEVGMKFAKTDFEGWAEL